MLMLGLWIPAYAKSRALRRRIGALAASSGGVALDLGGRRRSRGIRRPPGARANPLLHFFEVRLERAALDVTAGEVVAATFILLVSVGLSAGVLWGPTAGLVAGLIGGALP